MFSRTDPRSKIIARAVIAASATLAISCSASGDRYLGTLMPDNPGQTNAGSEAGVTCMPFGGPLVEAHSNLSLLFTVDRSQQSFTSDNWDTLASGFSHFLQSDRAGGMGMGIGYFPSEDSQRGSPCDPTVYQRPDVDIAALPQNAGQVATSLFAQNPFGGPTIRPALKGSLDHIAFFENTHPEQRVVDVLIVGGPPSSDCQQGSIAACADVAGSSNAKTFVVAFDTDEALFDPIAARGGTRRATRFDANSNIESQLVDLIDNISTAPFCEYELPRPGLDLRSLDVTLTAPSDAGFNPLTRVSLVDNRAGCDNVMWGWYFDRTHIVACDRTCARILGGMQPQVQFCEPTPL